MSEALIESRTQSLTVLRLRRDVVLAALNEDGPAVMDFVISTSTGRAVLARSDSARPEASVDNTDHATSTAFALAVILSGFGTGSHPLASPIANDRMLELVGTAQKDYLVLYPEVETMASQAAEEQKDTAPLPNPYNSSVHLWSIAAMTATDLVDVSAAVAGVGNRLADTLGRWLQAGAGSVGGLDPEDEQQADVGRALIRVLSGAGSPYLTYLAVKALCEWVQATGDESVLAHGDALRLSFTSAQAELSKIIAAYHSGVQSLFDSVDLVCALARVGLTSRALKTSDELSDALVKAGSAILAEEFLLDDGSFAPKAAAFQTRTGDSVMISSAELGYIFLDGVGERLNASQLSSFDLLIDGVVRRRSGARGWGVGARGSHARRTSFVTVAALGMMSAHHELTTTQIRSIAEQELGISRLENKRKIYPLPAGSVGEDIERFVIEPILAGDRDVAGMSFVLGGPPGTAKTTIAHTVASRLGWPLLVIDLGTFLKRGIGGLESEAERIFDLLMEVSDVVVLFDEIEEVVLTREPDSEREGRFLTSAMLPRLHRLRDAQRVVFAIATNYPARLDGAAVRPGRIDFIFTVSPPSREQRELMLGSFAADFNAPDALRDFLTGESCLDGTDNFTVGYLSLIVRMLVRMDELWDNPEKMMEVVRGVSKRVEAEQATPEVKGAARG